MALTLTVFLVEEPLSIGGGESERGAELNEMLTSAVRTLISHLDRFVLPLLAGNTGTQAPHTLQHAAAETGTH